MHDTYSNLGCFSTVYIMAAYISLYPNKLFEKKSIYIWGVFMFFGTFAFMGEHFSGNDFLLLFYDI